MALTANPGEQAMTIAVTGATGHLGRLVVDRLKAKTGEAIVALVRSPTKAEGLGVAVREADYAKPATLKPALAGVDALLLISSSEIGQRASQHHNVIEAAKAAGVKRIVIDESTPCRRFAHKPGRRAQGNRGGAQGRRHSAHDFAQLLVRREPYCLDRRRAGGRRRHRKRGERQVFVRDAGRLRGGRCCGARRQRSRRQDL